MPKVLALTAKPHRSAADAELDDKRRQDRLCRKEVDQGQEGDQRDDAETGAVSRDHAERRGS